eukprot:39670-Eustigmatos_ZCMA.PRE.1
MRDPDDSRPPFLLLSTESIFMPPLVEPAKFDSQRMLFFDQPSLCSSAALHSRSSQTSTLDTSSERKRRKETARLHVTYPRGVWAQIGGRCDHSQVIEDMCVRIHISPFIRQLTVVPEAASPI